jgi:hypothetical protein
MAGWMTCLVAINIAVTATNAPVMEAFKVQADEWRMCKFNLRLMCSSAEAKGVNCDPTPCNSHDDCKPEREYCTGDSVCSERCHECYEKNDGIGGACPSYNCLVSLHMSKMEQCIFRYCGDEVRACHSASSGGPSNCKEEIVQALTTSQGKGPVTAAAAQAGVACAVRNGCSDQTHAPVGSGTCVESFSENPACDCLAYNPLGRNDPAVQAKVDALTFTNVGCMIQSLEQIHVTSQNAQLLLPYSYCYIRDGANCPLTVNETTLAGKSAQELDDMDYIMLSR